jgi:hypothetical protein
MSRKLTIQDCRDAGFCISPGVKEACREHGVDFRQLIRSGVPLEQVEHIDDISVQRAVAIAIRRSENDGR